MVNATIRISAKGGGALHSASDLVMVTPDAGSYPLASQISLETLYSAHTTKANKDDGALHTPQDWLDPIPSTADTRRRRHTDVSQDPRYIHQDHSASDYDAECTTTPKQLIPWVLSQESSIAIITSYMFFSRGECNACAL